VGHERHQETKEPDYMQFAMGLRTGVASLYERRLGHYEPGTNRFKQEGTPVYYVSDHAVHVSGSKRDSFEDREHWLKLLKHTPHEAWHRGHLAAGLILSGADSYWGLRDDPDAAAVGHNNGELPDETARDESNQVFDFEVASDSGFDTYSVDNLGGGDYPG
jgi:hypothetical protein